MSLAKNETLRLLLASPERQVLSCQSSPFDATCSLPSRRYVVHPASSHLECAVPFEGRLHRDQPVHGVSRLSRTPLLPTSVRDLRRKEPAREPGCTSPSCSPTTSRRALPTLTLTLPHTPHPHQPQQAHRPTASPPPPTPDAPAPTSSHPHTPSDPPHAPAPPTAPAESDPRPPQRRA